MVSGQWSVVSDPSRLRRPQAAQPQAPPSNTIPPPKAGRCTLGRVAALPRVGQPQGARTPPRRSVAGGYMRTRAAEGQRRARRGSAAARRGARGVESGRAVGWSGRGTPRQDRDAAPPRLAGGHGGSRAAGRLGGAAAGPPARIETRLRRGSPGGTGGRERPGGWVERPRDPPPGSRRGSAAARRGARGVESGRAVGWSGRGTPRQDRDAAPPRLAGGHGGSRAAGRLGGAAAGPPARIETRLRRGSPGGTGGRERPGGWAERPRDPPPGSRRGSAAARRGARGVESGRAVGRSGRGTPRPDSGPLSAAPSEDCFGL